MPCGGTDGIGRCRHAAAGAAAAAARASSPFIPARRVIFTGRILRFSAGHGVHSAICSRRPEGLPTTVDADGRSCRQGALCATSLRRRVSCWRRLRSSLRRSRRQTARPSIASTARAVTRPACRGCPARGAAGRHARAHRDGAELVHACAGRAPRSARPNGAPWPSSCRAGRLVRIGRRSR